MCVRYVGTLTQAKICNGSVNVRGVKIPCNGWGCPECAKRKQIMLGNRVKEGMQNERVRFVTLTCRKGLSFCGRLKSLKEAWNRLRLSLSRRFGLSKFFWVLEFGHEHGRAHLHVLVNCFVPQRALSKLAVRCGFGSIVDIREVKSGGGFGYVYKYLGKDCGSKLGARALKLIRARRFGVSRNIPPLARKASEWENIEWVHGVIDDHFREETVQNVLAGFGNRGSVSLKSATKTEGSAHLYLSPEDTAELLAWYRDGIIDRSSLVEMGSDDVARSRGLWLCNIVASRYGLEDPPF